MRGANLTLSVFPESKRKKSSSLRARQRVWLLVLPMSGGAGLVIYVLSKISLLLSVGTTALVGITAFLIVINKTKPEVRKRIRALALKGAISGLAATMSYDLCRLIMVKLLHFSFWPFDIFSIFGRLLIGNSAPAWVATAIGILFHLFNGIGFSIGFIFIVQRPGILSGLAWAAMLELMMVSIYPSWLGLKALDEFLSVSIFGHAVYGLVLGIASRRLTKNSSIIRSANPISSEREHGQFGETRDP